MKYSWQSGLMDLPALQAAAFIDLCLKLAERRRRENTDLAVGIVRHARAGELERIAFAADIAAHAVALVEQHDGGRMAGELGG